MRERFAAYSSVLLILTREGSQGLEILLQRRNGTGFLDNMWECAASGHVERGESARAALVREAKEELCIDIPMDAAAFCTCAHKKTDRTGDIYYSLYFTAERYTGTPRIGEPNKCSALAWFPLNKLPEDLIPDRRRAIANWLAGTPYDEHGWGV